MKMIRRNQARAMPAVKRKIVAYTDFSATEDGQEKKGVLRRSESLNFTFSDGAISGGVGIVPVYTGSPTDDYEAKALYLYSSEEKEEFVFLTGTEIRRIALPLSSASRCEALAEKSFVRPSVGISFTSVAGGSRLLLYGTGGAYVYDGEGVKNFPDVPDSDGACLFNDRIFLVSREKRGRIRYSRPLAETDFLSGYGDAGYIDLDPAEGEIRGIFGGKENVLILRDGRSTFLSIDGRGEDFRVSHTLFDCKKIYKDSAAQIGDRVMFLGENGLYSFLQGKAKLVLHDRCGRLAADESKPICAGTWKGAYYVSYADLSGTARILFFDLVTETGFFVNGSVSSPVLYDGKCYFLQNGKLKTFVETAENGVYVSVPTDFGAEGKRKILREVELEGNGEFALNVSSEAGKRNSDFSLKNGFARACPLLKGRKFVFTLRGKSSDCVLRKLVAQVDVCEGEKG